MTEISYGEQRSPLQREVDFTLKQGVEKGIAKLREEFGGDDWVEFIDPNELLLCDADRCVLGQIYQDEARERGGDSGYFYGIQKLELGGRPAEYGFSITGVQESQWCELDPWQRLNEIWLDRIAEISK